MNIYMKKGNVYYRLIPEREMAKRLKIQNDTLAAYRKRKQVDFEYIKLEDKVFYIIKKK